MTRREAFRAAFGALVGVVAAPFVGRAAMAAPVGSTATIMIPRGGHWIGDGEVIITDAQGMRMFTKVGVLVPCPKGEWHYVGLR